MKQILQIEDVSPKQVVLKVNDLTLKDIAMNPMFNQQMEYITVTRGNQHTLTVIKKDGATFSFSWGNQGHTLISDNLERLRVYVANFIKQQKIFIDTNSDNVISAKSFYNQNFNKFQLTITTDTNQTSALFFQSKQERETYIEELGLTLTSTEPNPYVTTIYNYTK